MKIKKLIFLLLVICITNSRSQKTPLENFVYNNDDLSFTGRTLLSTSNANTFTTYKLNITSLKWFDASFSSRPIWWHYVYVNVPKTLQASYPIYFHIDHGTNDIDEIGSNDFISSLSTYCQCITVTMRQVPNQPIAFKIDPQLVPRYEDNLIAGTFYIAMNYYSQFPDNTYNNVPLLFPMTKAVKRTMDKVVEGLKELGVQFSERFILAGASKRGWTAYLTAAVDPRVISIVPVVYDFINIQTNFHSQYMSMGRGYTFALADYYNFNITKNLDTIEEYELFKLIDPYNFMDKLRGKVINMILATGDEFMLPENLKNFIRQLKIQTNNYVYVRLLNTNHSLTGQETAYADSIKSFLLLFSRNFENWPLFSWKMANNGTHGIINASLTNLKTFETLELSSYIANTLSNNRIDFRKNTINGVQNIKWVQTKLVGPLTGKTSYSYNLAVKRNTTVYVGFYLEAKLKFLGDTQYFYMATNINIVPEYYPVEDCEGYQCLGKLV